MEIILILVQSIDGGNFNNSTIRITCDLFRDQGREHFNKK